jgi:hypothetical protein
LEATAREQVSLLRSIEFLWKIRLDLQLSTLLLLLLRFLMVKITKPVFWNKLNV